MDFEFNLKTKLKIGQGSALLLGNYLKSLRFKKPAVIVDSGIYNNDYVKKVISTVLSPKIWVYDLKGEPDYDSLDRVRSEFSDNDCFIAIGGGSVIDFAKGLATLYTNPLKAIRYRGFPQNINPPLPVIALATTAGTASEVTYNAVFIDKKDRKKLGINTTYNFPVLAILDPKLTLTCPESVTVSSGIDALTHVLESYVAFKSNYLTKMFSREAFKLIFNNLYLVLDNPKNIEIRENLQMGAYLAGIALMNSGSGPAGALSYSLGVHFKVPHGLAGAVFLPYIVYHNVKGGYDYSELFNIISDKGINKEEKNKLFSDKIFELCDKLKVPSDLKSFGVNQENISLMLKDVEGYGPAFSQNPIPFGLEDAKKLLFNLI